MGRASGAAVNAQASKRTIERTQLATVEFKSGHAVLNLGSLPDRVRGCVVRHYRRIIAAALPAVVLSMAWMMWTGKAGLNHRISVDYQVYRWAVHTWLSGGDLTSSAPTVGQGLVLPWVYPPFALLPLSVFALLPFAAGLLLLYLVDLAALGACLYLVIRHLWPVVGKRGAAAVALSLLPFTLFLEPVYSNFGLGQVNIALMGLVALDCLVPHPRWPRGMLVGVAAAIKLTPAAFLLFFLARRDYRAAAIAVLTAIGGTALGFVLDFAASVDYWFGSGPAHGVSGSAYHTNQAIMGALARFQMSDAATNSLWLLLGALCVAAVVVCLRRVEPALAVVSNGLLALLVSPTSWSDHWVWCVPGLLVMLGYAVRLRSPGWLLAAVVTTVAVVMAPFRSFPSGPPWTAWQHLFGNAYLLLGLAFTALLLRYVLVNSKRGGELAGEVVQN